MNLPQETVDKLTLAQQAFREYYAACFWHMRPDLVVTQAMIPVIVKGLRQYGDRKAMVIAARLLE